MTEFPTTPQSVGGILDSGMKLCMRSARHVLPLALIGGVIGNFPAIFMAIFMQNASPEGVPPMPEPNSFFLLLIIPVILSLGFFNAILIRMDAVARNIEMTSAQALVRGLKRLPAVIVLWISFVVILFVGLLLLLVPGIYLSVSLYSAFYLVIVDNEGPFEAIKLIRPEFSRHILTAQNTAARKSSARLGCCEYGVVSDCRTARCI